MHSPVPAPVVTIVALCYNHAPYLRPALDSILAQDYPRLEVIMVDDASTDGSAAILREYAAANSTWQLLLLPENVGNCRAFNHGLALTRGEYVIDFATDDVLLPMRVTRQVRAFQQLPGRYGVVYSDAELIDEQGRVIRRHFQRDGQGQILAPQPASGWVFADVLRRYFISTPTMLMRRATLEALGGYDETLAYEDFDFWVRASREWQFYLLDEVTTQKRRHAQAMSRRGYRPHDPYLASTIKVCQKALRLCRDATERQALAERVRWEMRQATRWRSFAAAWELYQLLHQLRAVRPSDRLLGGSLRLLRRF